MPPQGTVLAPATSPVPSHSHEEEEDDDEEEEEEEEKDDDDPLYEPFSKDGFVE